MVFCYISTETKGNAGNAGVENERVENTGGQCQGWNHGSGKRRTLKQVWKANSFLDKQDDCNALFPSIRLFPCDSGCIKITVKSKHVLQFLSDLRINWHVCNTICKACCWRRIVSVDYVLCCGL